MFRSTVFVFLLSLQLAGAPANSIGGRVIDAATRRPIADALVSLLNPAGGTPDTVRTDRDGRFMLTRVPAGEWVVGATASGYAGTGTSIGRSTMTMTTGGSIGDVVIALKPFGVITGSVHMPNGEPAVGVTVSVLRRLARGQYRTFQSTTTDDLGNYRFGTLTSGAYVVSVPASVAPISGGTFVFPMTYLPGVTNADLAEVITVESGPARVDARIGLQAEPGVAVSGVLVGTHAPDLTGMAIDLRRDGHLVRLATDSERATVGPNGQFSFTAVTPGRYTLSLLKTPPTNAPAGPTVVVDHALEVGSRDMTGISVPVTRGVRVSGRVVFEGTSPRPTAQQLSRPLVVMQSVNAVQSAYLTGRTTDAGTFETVELPPGRYYLFSSPPEPWALKSAIYRGQDITDTAILIDGDALEDVVLTYTDRPPTLVGTTRDAKSSPVSARVVAFPVDQTYWSDPRTNRRTQLVSATTSGVYRFTRLPAGEYFVTVLETLDTDEWNDPVNLRALAGAATRVTLTDGVTTTADLRVTGGTTLPVLVDAAEEAPATTGPFVADEVAPQATTLSGVVRSAVGDGVPLAGASVRLTRVGDGTSWSTYSDNEGAFTFTGIGHGTFRLTATKPAHLPATFGTSTPGLPGRVLVIAEGAQSTAILTMHRGGVITGVVRDSRGRPLPATTVRVFEVSRQGHTIVPLSQVGESATPVTDDLGVYRVFGLPPGDYVVLATPEMLTSLAAGRVTMTDGADAHFMAHAPALHPVARSLDEARVVRLAAGDEAAGVDVTLPLGRAAALEGAVVMPDGAAPAGQVSFALGTADGIGPIFTALNGRIAIRAWTTGTYRLRARATVAGRLFWASAGVTLGDQDVNGLGVRLAPAPALTLRVVGPADAGLPAAKLRVTVTPLPSLWRAAAPSSFAVNAEGTAEVPGVFPGRYRVTVDGLPPGWVGRTVIADVGETSTPMQFEIPITNTPNRLDGRVLGGEDGVPVHVLAFAQDEAHWHPDSDRVVLVAPDSHGRYVFDHLPSGLYHVVPVAGLTTSRVADPTVLRALVDGAEAVTVADGIPQSRDVVIRRAPDV